MAIDPDAHRSRRALLTAAAGGAAALAASAAMPLAVAAHDADDVQKGTDNPTTATTSITNSGGSTAFAGSASGTGFGVQSTSAGGTGLFAWSVSGPAAFDPSTDGPFTGVYGFSPANSNPDFLGVGVWGDSDDVGVFGTGSIGVYGSGSIGVVGQSTGADAGVLALAAGPTDIGLEVEGKVVFSRSGKAKVSKNKSSCKVSLGGVSTSSRIFAVCYTNRSARWVRAAVPHSGYFNIYMNAKVSATTYVSWWVLN